MNKHQINVENLQISTKEGKNIVSNTNLQIKSGKLVAIIGPSGSGKTTLLNSIASKIQDGLIYSGLIKTNGIMKFVPQEDQLNGFYTVDGYLNHYLNMNYGFIDQNTKAQIVERTLIETGLISCRDTKVGDVFMKGLSGGQKRRLSIALELIGNPDILVLDEPTTGLDSVSAYHVMDLLKKMADQNKTVVCSIHQPSSQIWSMIDQVILISGSFICFNGSTAEAKHFFESIGKVSPEFFNPSDYFLFQINSDFDAQINPKQLNTDFLQWSSKAKINEEENLVSKNIDGRVDEITSSNRLISGLNSKGNFFTKTLFMTQRYGINSVLNPGIIFVRLAMYIMLCFCIGFMYFQLGTSFNHSDIVSRASLLFYVDAFLVFMSIAVMPFFMIERGIFEKEVGNRLIKPVNYQLAMFFSSIPAVAIIAIVSSLLVNLIAGLNGFGIFFVILFLSLICGESLAMLVSLLVPHFIIGMAVVAGLYGIFMICQGFLIIPSRIPGYFIWIYYIAFHTYSFQGFMVNEFRPDQKFNSTDLPTGNKVLEFYGMENAPIYRSCLILTGYALGLQVIIFFMMLYLYRRRKI